jgi:hypothetical protein
MPIRLEPVTITGKELKVHLCGEHMTLEEFYLDLQKFLEENSSYSLIGTWSVLQKGQKGKTEFSVLVKVPLIIFTDRKL